MVHRGDPLVGPAEEERMVRRGDPLVGPAERKSRQEINHQRNPNLDFLLVDQPVDYFPISAGHSVPFVTHQHMLTLTHTHIILLYIKSNFTHNTYRNTP